MAKVKLLGWMFNQQKTKRVNCVRALGFGFEKQYSCFTVQSELLLWSARKIETEPQFTFSDGHTWSHSGVLCCFRHNPIMILWCIYHMDVYHILRYFAILRPSLYEVPLCSPVLLLIHIHKHVISYICIFILTHTQIYILINKNIYTYI